MRFVRRVRGALAAALTLAALTAPQVGATEIWNGPLMAFTNLPGSDPTLPSSQDRITLDVWLTRGATRGLYNAAVETGYSSLSPVGTEWAYGALADYASLNYQTWVAWYDKNPSFMVAHNAVLHIIPEDVYLGIQFTIWNIGSGGFTYSRSTPPVPETSSALMLVAGTAAIVSIRFHSRRPRASAVADDGRDLQSSPSAPFPAMRRSFLKRVAGAYGSIAMMR
jgi:hypothetical protein